eukprot:1159827-Pelagomonas_calceolata.AAC.18
MQASRVNHAWFTLSHALTLSLNSPAADAVHLDQPDIICLHDSDHSKCGGMLPCTKVTMHLHTQVKFLGRIVA